MDEIEDADCANDKEKQARRRGGRVELQAKANQKDRRRLKHIPTQKPF